MNHLVLDAHAILRFLQDEAGAEQVQTVLAEAQSGKVRALVCEINLSEVYYLTARRFGLEFARRLLDHFAALPVERVSASWELIVSAAEVKVAHSLSYADCFAVATALKHQAVLVTGDPEFKKVEGLVEVDWI
jgi:predicted nucleic acid-binding protein